MMVSPHNDHQNPSFSLLVKQDSLNKIHTKEEEEEPLFIQNPSSASTSSSSAPIVLGNIDLKEPSCKTSIEHVWDKIFQENAINNHTSFQEQLSLRETTSYEQVLVRDGNFNDQHSMEISPGQPLMSIDPMAMDDSPSFKILPEIGNYLGDQKLMGFPALPLQVERKCQSINETMEKSVERRQRRMIKNRESAARSRARKQAHTTMLEKQVSELRRRNNWLKKIKEAEMVLNSDQRATPRYQLRRTTSSTF